MAHVADGQGDRVESKAAVALVPARPGQLMTGRGWPKLGAAWSTIWRWKRPPESQLAEV